MNLPITPNEARKNFTTTIPACIINAVNKLITAKIGTSKSVKILQDDILEEAGAGKDNSEFRNEILANKWLDIEPIFEKAGWKVAYDKPAYCESYPAFFTFTEK